MPKLFLLIIILITFGCQTSDSVEKVNIASDTLSIDQKYSDITLQQILETKKGFLEGIVLLDIRSFSKVPKDTLIVHFASLDFCGNSPIERIDGSPLFKEVKNKAIAFGFKTIINDTTDLIDLKPYENLPHYILDISANGNDATIMQDYYYVPNNVEIVQTIKDTTITLEK